MKMHNLIREPIFSHGRLMVLFGAKAANLGRAKEHDCQTYVFSENGGRLSAGRAGNEVLVPRNSLVRVNRGTRFSFLPAQSEDIVVVKTIGEPDASTYARTPTEAQFAAMRPNTRELNGKTLSYLDGNIMVFTQESRFIPGNPGRVTGWYTHNFKGCDIAIAADEWKEVRAAEAIHRHIFATEFVIAREGEITLHHGGKTSMPHGGKETRLLPGHLYFVEPKEGQFHTIKSITLGASGFNKKITINFPAALGVQGERILLDSP